MLSILLILSSYSPLLSLSLSPSFVVCTSSHVPVSTTLFFFSLSLTVIFFLGYCHSWIFCSLSLFPSLFLFCFLFSLVSNSAFVFFNFSTTERITGGPHKSVFYITYNNVPRSYFLQKRKEEQFSTFISIYFLHERNTIRLTDTTKCDFHRIYRYAK